MLERGIGSFIAVTGKVHLKRKGDVLPSLLEKKRCFDAAAGLASLVGIKRKAISRNPSETSVMRESACCESSIDNRSGDSAQTGKLLKEVSRAFSKTCSASDDSCALLANAQQLRHRCRTFSQEKERPSRNSLDSQDQVASLGSLASSRRRVTLLALILLLPLVLLISVAAPRTLLPSCNILGAIPSIVGSLAVCGCVWFTLFKDFHLRGKRSVQGLCSECEFASNHHSKEEEEIQLAQRAHRAKQQFMAYVFHNIRVPFNAIVLGLGHMRASASGNDIDTNAADTLDLVQLMLDCAETMTNVLDDVTDMGNWEEGRIELNKDVFDLLAVVKFLAWGLKDLLEQKQISLNIDIDPVASNILKSHNIVGDKHRTVQTLGNFLSNAVKFTPTGGKLDLEIKCEELDASSVSQEECNGACNGVHEHKSIKLFIAVNDTGAGISSDDQDKLFEADSFISSSWVQKAGVSGLGLSVAKRFIEQIGGQIGVRSLEQGSTFFFSAPFPLVPVQKRANCSVPTSGNFYTEYDKNVKKLVSVESLAEVTAATQAIPCSRRKVLLVEDTRINRIILRKVLQNLNLQCDEAENGQIAVDLHREGKSYDLVLMDKEMPVMDGHEATRTLRMMGVKTPIVALTGNALQSDKELFFEAGVNEFQTKPLSRDKLIQLLARYGVESSL